MKIFLSFILTIFFISLSYAKESCSVKKVLGFSNIKSDKAFFFKDTKECKSNETCPNKRKAYLVKGDFVQTGESEGSFTCALYRNFNGYGGKETTGWLLKADLAEIKKNLTLEQISGSWYKNDCGGDESCILTISKTANGDFEVDGTTYLHDHPGMVLETAKAKNTQGRLKGTGKIAGFEQSFNFEVDYSSDSLEPGTIQLINADSFTGEYHR